MNQKVEVLAETTGTIWKLLVQPGQTVAEGDVVAIIESMKMEIPVESPCAGRLLSLNFAVGQAVKEGDSIAWVNAA